MGGLFGTWTLLNHPEAFNRYVIGSPWLCWDEKVSTGWEAEYAAAHSDLPATVFLAAGAEEHIRGPYATEWVSPVFARAGRARSVQGENKGDRKGTTAEQLGLQATLRPRGRPRVSSGT